MTLPIFLLLSALALPPGAQAGPDQTPPAAQASPEKTATNQPAKKKARRVLTDDDFDSTRNPKALQEAAAEAPKTAEKGKPQAAPAEIEEQLKPLREELKAAQAWENETKRRLAFYKQEGESTDPLRRENALQLIKEIEEEGAENQAKILDLEAKIGALEKQKKAPEPAPPQAAPPEEKKEDKKP